MSDIDGQEVTADDSANPVSSNGGLAIPVAIENRFGIVKGLAELWRDTRDPAKVLHSIFDILFFRILAIVAVYKGTVRFLVDFGCGRKSVFRGF